LEYDVPGIFSVIVRDKRSSERHVRYNFHSLDAGVFRGVGAVREILRWIEVARMLDTIVSLTICVGLLVYLVYAMLRPEKF
jgi:K+-transporting ATPase KdpF subunit